MTRTGTAIQEHRFEIAPGRRINFARRPGGARTLVLVHGLGARWQTFKRLISSFDPDWTVYAIDQRGHGQSDWAQGNYSLVDFRGDLIHFITHIVKRPTFVYGHSLGGWVAALSAPHLFRQVYAVGLEDSALYEPAIEQQMQMLDFVYPNTVMRAANPALRQADPLLEERWTSRRAHQEQDPEAMFRDLAVPVLLVRGDPEAGGLLDANAAGRALTHLTVPYRHVYVPGAPHAVHAKEPATVRQAILECAHAWLPASKTHHWTTTEGVDPAHDSRMMSGTTISDNN